MRGLQLGRKKMIARQLTIFAVLFTTMISLAIESAASEGSTGAPRVPTLCEKEVLEKTRSEFINAKYDGKVLWVVPVPRETAELEMMLGRTDFTYEQGLEAIANPNNLYFRVKVDFPEVSGSWYVVVDKNTCERSAIYLDWTFSKEPEDSAFGGVVN